MLKFNNNPLTTIASKKPSGKNLWVKEKFDELDKLFVDGLMKFKYPPSKIFKEKHVRGGVESILSSGPAGINPQLARTIRRDGISERWIFYETEHINEKTGHITHRPGRLSHTGRHDLINGKNVFTRDDLELLFYLVYISGYCAPIEGCTDQKTDRTTWMVLVDKSREAKTRFTSEQAELKVKNALYGEDILSFKNLQTLAMYYQVDDVESIKEEDSAILKNRISDIVLKAKDKTKSVDNFLERFKIDETTKIVATIKKAKDRKIIGMKDKNAWHWMGEDAQYGNKICFIDQRKSNNHSIKVHFLNNPEQFNQLCSVLKSDISE